MVIYELISAVAKKLKENAMFEAQQIVMSAAGMNNTEIVLGRKKNVSDEIADRAFEMAKHRIKGKPLQYILGTAQFMGLEFKVNKNVLIPRADTETLVETVLDEIKDTKVSVLDIGTGSGCIGISIAHFNKDADVTFLDVSESALSVAKENAKSNCICGKFIQMDILKGYPDGKFDVVVSNPPYIRPEVIDTLQTEVKDHEPYGALYGGDDGLIFYSRITDIAPRILKNGGILAFEIGYDQGKDVIDMMGAFRDVRLIKDLQGNDRVVIGTLKE